MANLLYTALQLQGAAQHAAAKTSFGSGNSPILVVNAAIEHLVSAHDWTWRKKIASLNTVSAQIFVDLPADFGELVALRGQTTPYHTKRFRKVSEDDLILIRQRATEIAANARAASTVFYCVTGKAQASVTVAGTYQLDIHPSPGAVTNAFYLVYRRLAPTVSGDTDVVDIPAAFHDLLKQCVRAFAVGREAGTSPAAAAEWGLFDRMLASRIEMDKRITSPAVPVLANVIDDCEDVGKVLAAWS
jgi:hypothetical protein